MSEISHALKKTRRRNRNIVSHTYKSSTPHKNVPVRHYSISLSGIDTGSSSSVGEVRKKPRSKILGKRKKVAGKKRRVTTRLADSDSEWETKSKESIKMALVDSRGSNSKDTYEEYQDDAPMRCNLFEDLCTPEKVRDAPIAYEPLLESPIIQSSRKLRLIPVKNNLIQCEELVPVPNLQLSKSQNVNPEETDDDAPIFHHEKDMKTYSAPPKRNKSPEKRLRNFTFRLRFPTATSDLLWDEFVDKFHDEISQYLASPSTQAPAKLTDSARGLPDVTYSKRIIEPLPPGMKCVSQRYDEATRRWITCSDSERENTEWQNESKTDGRKFFSSEMKVHRKNARKRGRKTALLKSVQKRRAKVYDQSDETDIEFETSGRNKKRISFREFCRRQRVNKTKTPSTSSHSDTQ